MNVQFNLDLLQIQLTNGVITTPAIIRLNKSQITIEFPLTDCYLSVQFSLTGSNVVMVTRNYPNGAVPDGGPQVLTLYSFQKP